ncbi:MAG: rhodanese-like domain-containing protein [Verrucomicrobiae bacterium]|nr:rhodanese-like domain-containing protein [Verrucomicrobiae bacterium]
MSRNDVKTKMVVVFSVACALGSLPLMAMTPAELAAALGSGAKITVVDVRNNSAYQKSHIPGAINIPAPLCPLKELPPLGHVVVYDDGLGQEKAAEKAAAALNSKPGIRAEVLEGGFTSWQMHQNRVVADRGIAPEQFTTITYDQLKAAAPESVVLVDLRTRSSIAQMKGFGTAESLTDLQKEFPGFRVVRAPFSSSQLASNENRDGPLLVLIDRNDGRAEQVARLLKAQGIRRFAILLGGETMLARKGRPGLQRSGAVVSVPATSSPELQRNHDGR